VGRGEGGREGFFPRNRRKRFIRGSGPFTGVLRFSSCLDLTIASSTFAIKIVRVGMEWGSQSSMRTVYPAREYMYTYTGGFRIQCTGIRAAVFPPFSPPCPPLLFPTRYISVLPCKSFFSRRERRKNSHYARVSVYTCTDASTTHARIENTSRESERDAQIDRDVAPPRNYPR